LRRRTLYSIKKTELHISVETIAVQYTFKLAVMVRYQSLTHTRAHSLFVWTYATLGRGIKRQPNHGIRRPRSSTGSDSECTGSCRTSSRGSSGSSCRRYGACSWPLPSRSRSAWSADVAVWLYAHGNTVDQCLAWAKRARWCPHGTLCWRCIIVMMNEWMINEWMRDKWMDER